tara:strand:- start:516 stop:734 length:219 start_codon:yes stop_codon:yes gene_type:complete
MTDSTPSISSGEAQAILDAIDTAIKEGGDVASYTVNGRSVNMRSLDELLRARKYYEAMKARANNLRYTKVRF